MRLSRGTAAGGAFSLNRISSYASYIRPCPGCLRLYLPSDFCNGRGKGVSCYCSVKKGLSRSLVHEFISVRQQQCLSRLSCNVCLKQSFATWRQFLSHRARVLASGEVDRGSAWRILSRLYLQQEQNSSSLFCSPSVIQTRPPLLDFIAAISRPNASPENRSAPPPLRGFYRCGLAAVHLGRVPAFPSMLAQCGIQLSTFI